MSVPSDLSLQLSSLSLPSRASSSLEPASTNSQLHGDTLKFIYEVLYLEGCPTHYEWLVTFGRQRVIELLLEKGCPGIKHGTTNQTLSDYIANFLWPDVLQLLADLGAKGTHRNCRGDTAVHLAFNNNATEGRVFTSMLESYLDSATKNVANNDGLSFLHIACAHASADRVQKLLDVYPGDINQQVAVRNRVPFAGYTPLHFAVEYNRYDIVDLLLRNNADIYAIDRLSMTPLHRAAYGTQGTQKSDMIDIIDRIFNFDLKCDNSVDNFGLSHLMVACVGSRASIVEKILQVAEIKRSLPPTWMVKRQVMNTVDTPFGGFTPLHFAAQNGNFETARLLLNHGASTHGLTNEQYTPVALARLGDHHLVLRLLENYS